MKNKFLVFILATVCAFACMFGLAACAGDETEKPSVPPAHDHAWSRAWSNDDTHHWHNCTASGCTVTDNSKKDGYAAHDFSDGDCVCGKGKPAATHSHNYKWVNNWDGTHKQHCQNADCPEPDISDGEHTYVSTGLGPRCDKCGDFEAPEGHTHDYVWKDDGTTHSVYCLAEGCFSPNPAASTEQHVWGENGICDKCRAVDLQLHKHNVSTVYYCNEVNHYQKCDSCNRVVSYGDHNPKEGAACTSCGHKATTSFVNFTFKENDDQKGYTITKFTSGTVKDVVVPCVYFGKPVTAIAADAFKNSNITSVEISGCCLPNSGEVQMTIEPNAFSGCTKLKNIVIPKTVVEIKQGAFEGCTAVTDLTVPFIGWKRFDENDTTYNSFGILGHIFGGFDWHNNGQYVPATLSTVTVTDSTIITPYAFRGSKVKSITLPDGLKTIGEWALGNFPLASVNIPSTVTTIGESAFKSTAITSITLPNGLQAIESSVFENCSSLAEVTIGSGIKSIGENAFNGCNKLKDVYYAGDLAGWCGITGLGGIMSLSTTLYIGGKKPSGEITIPNNVTSIGADAFYGCNEITSVRIHANVTSIGNGAFGRCAGLKTITVDESNTVYASQDGILYNKAKTLCIQIPDDLEGEVTVPDGITHISFAHPKLTAINLPDSITMISFIGCGITELTLPVGVTDVSIMECADLTALRYKGTAEQWQDVKSTVDASCPSVTFLGE